MKFKKLIPALAMLLVAAVLMGTSSFAWFSMNTSVSATDMQVVVKSDNTYLLINKTATTASAIQSAGLITEALTVSDAEAKVYPSSPALTDAEEAYLTVATGHNKVDNTAISLAGEKVEDAATAAVVTNWFTANALAPNAAAIDTTSAKQLTTFTGYVIHKTVYLTLAVGSTKANNLTVTPTFTQKDSGTDLTAVKILVTTSDGGFANITSAQTGTAVDIKGDNTDLTDQLVRTVDIYIYYDGDETPVYTNNAANLKGADISLAFGVTANPGA